ncbi:hypothetical protein LOTGIDRAFT_174546 [Lottia gigantea]|uniref:Uncharacterized protein n=1 Tax=Lottia gigantea TaxID=225164 RepID=V4AQQ5_LOTGI|nr:hypothetical protein LOTGIDRAFT_174546 [Lottia gigantea]ESO97160.1 hypothetical protein LOTGIDRAFT_174546 [Lottia gigantea]
MANKFGLGSLSLETKKPNTTAWINKTKPYFLDQIGDTLQGISEDKLTALESKLSDDSEIQKQIVAIQQQLINVVDKTQLQNLSSLISNLDDKITKQKIELIDNINPGKLTIEITFPIQVKVDSLFFRQDSISSNKFNARKVLQFINGTKNVETKELEINDKNNKISHLHEIKTNGQYIDRFRMLIIPDNEKDEFLLSDFDMLLETETPPSMNIIRNPEPEKKDVSDYEFLRATDFEYVKLYFVDNDIFTSVDIHKSQQNQKFLIRDGVYVNISIYIEKPKFSVHLNKINDSKEQISLVTVTVNSKAAISEVHLI